MARPKKNIQDNPAEMLARYQRIVEAFDFAGLESTQQAIGARLSPPVTQGGVSHWKESNPSVGYLVQIVNLTGVNGHWLLMGKGSKANTDKLIQSMIDNLPAAGRKSLLAKIQADQK